MEMENRSRLGTARDKVVQRLRVVVVASPFVSIRHDVQLERIFDCPVQLNFIENIRQVELRKLLKLAER
jgi:hypothetical protein